MRLIQQYPGLFSILRNGVWQSFTAGYGFIIRLFYILAISSMLGPEGYGFFAYAQTYYLIYLPIIMFGVEIILPREIGKRGKDSEELISRTFSLRVTTGAILTLIAIVIGFNTEPTDTYKLLIVLICLALVPRAIQVWCHNVFLGYERSEQAARLSVIYRTAETVIGVSLLYFFQVGLLPLILLHIAIWWLFAIASTLYIHRNIVPIKLRIRLSDFKDIWGENLLITLQMFLEQLLLSTVLIVYRHTTTDMDSFGQFALAYQAIIIMIGFFAALNGSSAPVMIRSTLRGDGKDRIFAIGMSGAMFMIGLIAIAVTYYLGDIAVLGVLGGQYALTAELLLPMALWVPLMVAGTPLQIFLNNRKHVRAIIKSYLAAWIVLVLQLHYQHEQAEDFIQALVFAAIVQYTILLGAYHHHSKLSPLIKK